MTRKGTCKHFNGARNNTCEAGVNYDGLPHPEPPPNAKTGMRLPCLRCDGKDFCDKWEEPTAEEIAEHEKDMAALMDRFKKSQPWITAMKKEHPKGTNGFAKDSCPICQSEITFNISGYNRHMHARCSTPDCLNFME